MPGSTIKGSFKIDGPERDDDEDDEKSNSNKKGKKKGKDDGKITIEYCETKTSNQGGGPRGIDVWQEGAKGRMSYDIDPNPHDNKTYNKKQSDFYASLAEAVAAEYVSAGKWPKKIKVTWAGETYVLSS